MFTEFVWYMVEGRGRLTPAIPLSGVPMGRTVIAVIFALFVVCFVAIVVEELFLAGRRRRILEGRLRKEMNRGTPSTMEKPCD
jgi:hypothetical protein